MGCRRSESAGEGRVRASETIGWNVLYLPVLSPHARTIRVSSCTWRMTHVVAPVTAGDRRGWTAAAGGRHGEEGWTTSVARDRPARYTLFCCAAKLHIRCGLRRDRRAHDARHAGADQHRDERSRHG